MTKSILKPREWQISTVHTPTLSLNFLNAPWYETSSITAYVIYFSYSTKKRSIRWVLYSFLRIKRKYIYNIILLLKAEANRSNISFTIKKFPCWMKCWTGLADRKFWKRRKNRVGWFKICVGWVKIMLDEISSNISSKIFPSFEHIFYVGYVCPLFHPTFVQHLIQHVGWNVGPVYLGLNEHTK